MRIAPIVPAVLILAATACGGGDSPTPPAQNNGSISVAYSGSANGSLAFSASPESRNNDMTIPGA